MVSDRKAVYSNSPKDDTVSQGQLNCGMFVRWSPVQVVCPDLMCEVPQLIDIYDARASTSGYFATSHDTAWGSAFSSLLSNLGTYEP